MASGPPDASSGTNVPTSSEMTSRDSCDRKLMPLSLKFVMAAPAV